MTLVFWQNIISPHQLPYIQAIGLNNSSIKVLLVVEKPMAEQRKQMGWKTEEVTNSNNFKIISEPKESQMVGVFKNHPNAQHFFSGIRSNPMVYAAFKESLKYKVKRHLIVEGPFLFKYPLLVHYFKTLITDYKYFKYISSVFAIGSHALNWYPKFKFKREQIIPFSYCVEKKEITNKISNTGVVKFIFIGGLIPRKGVDLLLKSLLNIKREYSLDIIGDGPEREWLEVYCHNNNLKNVRFLGTKDNLEARSLIENYDVLILPSRHDGWGAVVNEALMAGLFVLCSENCGAQELIKDKFNGLVFSHKKKGDLYNALTYCIENVEQIRGKKDAIKEWSVAIEGTTIADYFITSLNNSEALTPPWKIYN